MTNDEWLSENHPGFSESQKAVFKELVGYSYAFDLTHLGREKTNMSSIRKLAAAEVQSGRRSIL